MKRSKEQLIKEIEVLRARLKGLEMNAARQEQLEGALNVSGDALRQIIDFDQTLINTIPYGIEVVDAFGNILYANKKLEEMFGEASGDKKCWEIYKDNKRQCVHCPLKSGIRLGKTDCVEIEHVFGGRTYLISHTGMLYNGKEAILEFFQDITVRKEAEKSLAETMKIKADFVSTVSHELRTPITIVMESISLVKRSGQLTEEQEHYLTMTDRNLKRLARLVNEVLDFRKLDAGKEKFHIKRNKINDVAKEVCESLRSVAEKKGIKLVFELDAGVADSRFDRDKIHQVLLNLVYNAIKFTENGKITIVTGRDNNNIHVSVNDTGPGLTSDDLLNLFRPFRQLGPAKKGQQKGTGLGLIISKKIIDRHGGKIRVESEFGKGSTFQFIIPA